MAALYVATSAGTSAKSVAANCQVEPVSWATDFKFRAHAKREFEISCWDHSNNPWHVLKDRYNHRNGWESNLCKSWFGQVLDTISMSHPLKRPGKWFLGGFFTWPSRQNIGPWKSEKDRTVSFTEGKSFQQQYRSLRAFPSKFDDAATEK